MVEDFFNLIHPKLNTHPNHFLGGLISFLTEKSQDVFPCMRAQARNRRWPFACLVLLDCISENKIFVSLLLQVFFFL